MGREPLTILLADHDLEFANVLVGDLQPEGHEVHIATTGAHALEIARGARIDCVLLDLHLPDIDSIDVAAQLRAGILSATAIIIMTNSVGASLAKTDSVDIDMILNKPRGSEELLSGLIRHLQSLRRRKVRGHR